MVEKKCKQKGLASSISPKPKLQNSPLPFQLRHRLTEVDVNPPIINQNVVHLEVGLLAVLRPLKLDEAVLKTLPGPLVGDNLAADDTAETAEDHLEVLLPGDWVELADEEDVLRRGDVRIGQVADHLEDQRPLLGVLVLQLLLELLRGEVIVDERLADADAVAGRALQQLLEVVLRRT